MEANKNYRTNQLKLFSDINVRENCESLMLNI